MNILLIILTVLAILALIPLVVLLLVIVIPVSLFLISEFFDDTFESIKIFITSTKED